MVFLMFLSFILNFMPLFPEKSKNAFLPIKKRRENVISFVKNNP